MMVSLDRRQAASRHYPRSRRSGQKLTRTATLSLPVITSVLVKRHAGLVEDAGESVVPVNAEAASTSAEGIAEGRACSGRALAMP